MSWSEFISMGGYGAYVWSAYGLTALVLVWNLMRTRLRRREILRNLKRFYRREDLPS